MIQASVWLHSTVVGAPSAATKAPPALLAVLSGHLYPWARNWATPSGREYVSVASVFSHVHVLGDKLSGSTDPSMTLLRISAGNTASMVRHTVNTRRGYESSNPVVIRRLGTA